METKTVQFIKKSNYQRITKNKVVRLRYVVFEKDSEQAIAYRDDLFYLHGGYGGAFPKIEAALEGLSVEAKVEVELAPDEGYGDTHPYLILTVPNEEIPADLRREGALVEGEASDGTSQSFRVVKVEPDSVTLDGNHPLAGKHLRFLLEVLDIRDASDAELQAGYAFSLSN